LRCSLCVQIPFWNFINKSGIKYFSRQSLSPIVSKQLLYTDKITIPAQWCVKDINQEATHLICACISRI
jgi:hypothetical protein